MRIFLVLAISAIVLAGLSSCYQQVYNHQTMRYEKQATYVNAKRIKIRKRHLVTYPPSELTTGLVEYRKRYNQWPKSLAELTGSSYTAMQALQQMRETHFQKIDIKYSNPDTLIIDYVYQSMDAKTERDIQRTKTVYNKYYPGQYIYITSGDNSIIENRVTAKKFLGIKW